MARQVTCSAFYYAFLGVVQAQEEIQFLIQVNLARFLRYIVLVAKEFNSEYSLNALGEQ